MKVRVEKTEVRGPVIGPRPRRYLDEKNVQLYFLFYFHGPHQTQSSPSSVSVMSVDAAQITGLISSFHFFFSQLYCSTAGNVA